MAQCAAITVTPCAGAQAIRSTPLREAALRIRQRPVAAHGGVGLLQAQRTGRYLRNGPNPRAATGHWFTGDGMIHGVRIENGRAAWYRNRWVRTDSFVDPFPLYREDGINLDQLMALCLSDDTAAQERAWFEAHEWDRKPASLRRRLAANSWARSTRLRMFPCVMP